MEANTSTMVEDKGEGLLIMPKNIDDSAKEAIGKYNENNFRVNPNIWYVFWESTEEFEKLMGDPFDGKVNLSIRL